MTENQFRLGFTEISQLQLVRLFFLPHFKLVLFNRKVTETIKNAPETLVFGTLHPLVASMSPKMYHTTTIQLVRTWWDTPGSIQLFSHGSRQ